MKTKFLTAICIWLACMSVLQSQEVQYDHFDLSAPIVVNVSEIASKKLIEKTDSENQIRMNSGNEEGGEFEIPGPFIEEEINLMNHDDNYFNQDFFMPEYPDFSNHERTVSPAPCQSYIGINSISPCPPVTSHWANDFNGAAGPDHIMELSGGTFQIKTKTGTTVSTVTDEAFFGGDSHYSHFDPRITYDIYNNRWIVIATGYNGYSTPSIGNLAIAVSQTSDPTGSWYIYNISTQTETGCTIEADYPYLGFNKKWIVISAYALWKDWSPPCTPIFGSRNRFYIMSKNSLFSGSVGTVTQIDVFSNTVHIVPAVTYDNTLNDLYCLESYAPNMKLYKISGPTAAPVFSSLADIPAPGGLSWTFAPTDLPQPSGVGIHNWTGDRIQNVVYRNGKLWATQHCQPIGTSRTVVQWWDINPTSYAVNQFGRIEDVSNVYHYAFPSIAVNANNDVLIGYSRFSSSDYASAGYSFRLSTDPANTIQDPYIYKAGEDDFGTAASTGITYGDYSGTYIDPVDNSFWTIQQYAKTRGVHSKFSGCWGSAIAANAGSWWAHVNSSAPPMPGTIIREDIDECCVYDLKVATSPLANSYEWKYAAGPWYSVPNTGPYNYYPLGPLELEGPYNIQVRAYNLCGYSSIRSASITCDMPGDCPLRQTEPDNEMMNDVTLYPNPANEYFTISFTYFEPGSNVNIFDISGNLLKTISVNENNETIHLENYPKGVYLISVVSESVSKNFRLIIE